MSEGSPTLGSFEEQVLLAVAHADAAAYGMAVRRAIEHRTGRDVTIGAVYATLQRLADKGLLETRVAEGEAGPNPRRFFVLTPQGARSLLATRRLHEQMWSGIDAAALSGLSRGES